MAETLGQVPGEELIKLRTLNGKKDVEIKGRKYFVSKIPAFDALMLYYKITTAFSFGGLAMIPEDTQLVLLSYAGTYTPDGMREIQFANKELINMNVVDPLELIELVTVMFEENFSFLKSGDSQRVASRLVNAIQGSTSNTSK